MRRVNLDQSGRRLGLSAWMRGAAVVVSAAGLAMGGCSKGRSSEMVAKPGAESVNTGLAALAGGASPGSTAGVAAAAKVGTPTDWTTEQTIDLQAVLKQLEARRAQQAAQAQAQTQAQAQAQGQPTAPASGSAVLATTAPTEPSGAMPAAAGTSPTEVSGGGEAPAEVATAEGVAPGAGAGVGAGAGAEVVITNPAAAADPLDVQIARTLVSLVDLLRRQSLESPAPFQAYMSLALLESMYPGAVMQIVSAQTTSGSLLSTEEQRVIEALRIFGQGAHALPTRATPGEMLDTLADMSAAIESALRMRIATTALATRVLSFGRYTPVPENRFIHGRTVRFLLYTEIEHFAYRELAEGEALSLSQQRGSGVDPADRYLVEVSQELQLYTPEGQLVWSLPEQSVVETSRNLRRDFFLTNDVTLPNTLGIGTYTLKVIMRDKTSGVADESNVEVRITADGVMAGATP